MRGCAVVVPWPRCRTGRPCRTVHLRITGAVAGADSSWRSHRRQAQALRCSGIAAGSGWETDDGLPQVGPSRVIIGARELHGCRFWSYRKGRVRSGVREGGGRRPPPGVRPLCRRPCERTQDLNVHAWFLCPGRLTGPPAPPTRSVRRASVAVRAGVPVCSRLFKTFQRQFSAPSAHTANLWVTHQTTRIPEITRAPRSLERHAMCNIPSRQFSAPFPVKTAVPAWKFGGMSGRRCSPCRPSTAAERVEHTSRLSACRPTVLPRPRAADSGDMNGHPSQHTSSDRSASPHLRQRFALQERPGIVAPRRRQEIMPLLVSTLGRWDCRP